MMLFDITYNSKKTEADISDLVGKPFSFMERVRMGGVGTSKLVLFEASSNIADLIQDRSSVHYCYLELRPAGLLVGFQSHLKTYVLAFPFWQLNIFYNSGQLSIYSAEYSMKLKAPFNGTVDKKYLKKVILRKAEFIDKQNQGQI